MGNTIRAVSANLFNAPPPTWIPSTSPDDSQGRSTQGQLQNLVLHWSVPVLLMVALATKDASLKQDLKHRKHEREYDTGKACKISFTKSATKDASLKQDLNHRQSQREYDTEKANETSCTKPGTPLKEVLDMIEKEEEGIFKRKLEKVSVYDEGLKDILDVKCSIFRSKQKREVTEENMMDRLSSEDTDLKKVMKLSQLRDVIKHDHRFCGNSREENGKLRQLYVQTWKLKCENEKYKVIIEKMKREIYKDQS